MPVKKSSNEYERGDIELGKIKPNSEYERGDIVLGRDDRPKANADHVALPTNGYSFIPSVNK